MMAYMLITHKVEDFSKWKPDFDAHKSECEESGMKVLYLWQSADDFGKMI